MLETSIEYLKGVGPTRAKVLAKELNIRTFQDLLEYFPFRYVDRSKFLKINQVQSDLAYVQIKGTVGSVELMGKGRGQRLTCEFYDETGSIELIWFQGIRYVYPQLVTGTKMIVFGKPNFFKGKKSIPHPELNKPEQYQYAKTASLQPVYSSGEKLSSKGLNSKGIEKLQRFLLQKVKGQLEETLPYYLLDDLHLLSRERALQAIHFPQSEQQLQTASFRLKIEELLLLQLQLLLLKVGRKKKLKGQVFERVGNHFNSFFENHLPFSLTNAQKRVIKEVRKDVSTGAQMNRLLQGDVGSGKTIVSLLCMLIAIDNGFQCALMAPTEILANQHYESLSELLAPTEVSVGLLTGSTKKAARRVLHEDLETGNIDILIGTHALIEDKVQFQNLGFVVIDEQHRFGVAQRARLWKKNTIPPHVLVMTATPIPRTLAMTLYGDLDVSVIDELPPGRKPIKTVHRKDAARLNVFGFMKDEIAKGRQVYVVYPLIEESEKLDYKDLMDGYESICRAFPRPHYQVGIVHGKMKPEDKDFEMNRFAKGETQLLVATTVIEVGVNVPNASVMVIESAERFGLSQLHQLRGRVGRGADQSYCILMTGDKLSNDAQLRMKTMCETNDGFKVADVDLQLRGPGDLMGTQQSGMLDLKIADLGKDQALLLRARQQALAILKDDPALAKPKNQLLKKTVQAFSKGRANWSLIS